MNMKGYNQLSPEMLSQAHMIGGPRMRTEAEEIEMMRNALTITLANIAGSVVSSVLEGGNVPSQEVAMTIAKTILEVSEDTKNDYEEIEKRKIRNQLAAQLLFSSLRGGQVPSEGFKTFVQGFFTHAAEILKGAEKHANEILEKDKAAPTSTDLPT